MTELPEDRRYTREHEWIKLEGETATVGITAFAQSELGDVTYVEVPKVGQKLSKGDPFGGVESGKAVSDIYAPVAGEVIEVNEVLADQPETVNDSPYERAWMIKLRVENPDEVETLLGPDEYEQHIQAGGH